MTTAIQTAIWAIVDQVPNYETTNPGEDVEGSFALTNDPTGGTTGYWMQQAITNYSLQTNAYYGAFDIITDMSKTTNAQEFLYMTPEPGTWALMATGLVMVGGVTVRNRRKTRPLATT